MHDQHRAKLPGGVRAELCLDRRGGNAVTVRDLEAVALDAVGGDHSGEAGGEMAVHAGEDAIARREGIHERHFPRAGIRAGEEQDVAALRLEHRLEPVKAFPHQAGEERPPMVDDGLGHGPDDALGD